MGKDYRKKKMILKALSLDHSEADPEYALFVE